MPKCPLCLASLKSGQELLRFCATCNKKLPPVRVGNAMQEQCDCRTRAIQGGVFLLHQGCARLNPLWRPVAQNIPDLLEFTWKGQPIKVDHWEIDLLRQASTLFPESREMWFPHEVFCAANDRRRGVLVKLSGPMDVGKTTLSSVVFNPASYVETAAPNPTDGHVANVEDYVYVEPLGSSGEAHREEDFGIGLLPSFLMSRHSTLTHWVRPTPARQFNVKAVILSAARKDADGPIASRFTKSLVEAGKFVKELANQVTAPAANEGREPGETRTVVFYDTPGEDNNLARSRWLIELDRSMHVAAFFVDASRLVRFWASDSASGSAGAAPPADSVSTVLQRIRTSDTGRLRACLVITKVDLVFPSMTEDEKEIVRQVEQGRREPDTDERQLLQSWLKHGAESHAGERELVALLQQRPSMSVFLLWSEGLDRPHEFPVGRGVWRFLNWCLGESAFEAPKGSSS